LTIHFSKLEKLRIADFEDRTAV